MRRWARPSRPLAPIAVAVIVLAIWWLVAHNGGSGWVQALGDVVFGTLAVGLLGPAVVLRRAKVRVVSAPFDSVAGVPVDLCVEASTRLRVRAVEPYGEEVFIAPRPRADAPARPSAKVDRSARDRIVVRPERRGVHGAVTLDIATAAPFALQWWTRRVTVALPSALHVAPRCGRPERAVLRPRDDGGESADWTPADVGQPRGACPYRPGDNRRQVHWRATADAGQLMVRELERPTAEPITVTVDLPDDPDAAERMAERALATVVRLLYQGAPVLLATREVSGLVSAAVVDRRGAGRRLARTVAHAGGPTAPSGVAIKP